MTSEAVPITALIATIRGWPAAAQAIRLIAPQIAAAGGEFIVADGSSDPPPSAEQLGDGLRGVRWLSLPGRSVFQLRLAGYRAARGEVIAITEDHVQVAADWIPRILAAHDQFPQAGAIGGAVFNKTNQKLVDWAAFFLTQGPFMAPLSNGIAERISGPANVSYKRRVLERLGGDDEHGVIDFLELPRALDGEALVADDSIRVWHSQSQGLVGTSLAEFDNGRTIAGYRRRQMTRGDWLRIMSSPVLPSYRAVRQMRIVKAKNMQDGMSVTRMAQALPAHIWFQYCAMAGELLGYAAGPGESPRRLF
jgi:Glycosyl transferase family 2